MECECVSPGVVGWFLGWVLEKDWETPLGVVVCFLSVSCFFFWWKAATHKNRPICAWECQRYDYPCNSPLSLSCAMSSIVLPPADGCSATARFLSPSWQNNSSESWHQSLPCQICRSEMEEPWRNIPGNSPHDRFPGRIGIEKCCVHLAFGQHSIVPKNLQHIGLHRRHRSENWRHGHYTGAPVAWGWLLNAFIWYLHWILVFFDWHILTLYDIISIISGTIHIQMPCLVRSWLPCHKEETFCLVPSPVAGQDHFGISPNQQTLQHPAGLLGLRQHQNVKQATLSSNICAFPKRIMYIVHTHVYIYIIQYIYMHSCRLQLRRTAVVFDSTVCALWFTGYKCHVNPTHSPSLKAISEGLLALPSTRSLLAHR